MPLLRRRLISIKNRKGTLTKENLPELNLNFPGIFDGYDLSLAGQYSQYSTGIKSFKLLNYNDSYQNSSCDLDYNQRGTICNNYKILTASDLGGIRYSYSRIGNNAGYNGSVDSIDGRSYSANIVGFNNRYYCLNNNNHYISSGLNGPGSVDSRSNNLQTPFYIDSTYIYNGVIYAPLVITNPFTIQYSTDILNGTKKSFTLNTTTPTSYVDDLYFYKDRIYAIILQQTNPQTFYICHCKLDDILNSSSSITFDDLFSEKVFLRQNGNSPIIKCGSLLCFANKEDSNLIANYYSLESNSLSTKIIDEDSTINGAILAYNANNKTGLCIAHKDTNYTNIYQLV